MEPSAIMLMGKKSCAKRVKQRQKNKKHRVATEINAEESKFAGISMHHLTKWLALKKYYQFYKMKNFKTYKTRQAQKCLILS
jgi:hypothetical protein